MKVHRSENFLYLWGVTVHLIKKQTILAFMVRYANSTAGFADWLNKIAVADWEKPEDMTCTFPSADLLGKGSSRVVFDIGGNKFRMICSYHFGRAQAHLFVNWIGTHAEYTRLCKEGKQYSISNY